MNIEQLFLENLDARSGVVILLAFLGGVVSSLLPCTIGMLPVLIGYVGGYSGSSRWAVLRQVLLFVLGVALVMTILGVAASTLGIAFGGLVGSGWYYAVGVVAIVMGLQLLGVINIPLPQLITKLPDSKPGQILMPIVLGMAFGAASSPCGTPFLTAILGFISQEKNLWLGGGSLFAYALGQSVLLIVVGLFTGLIKHMAVVRRVGKVINLLSGITFILAGALLIAQAASWLDWFAL